MPDYQQFLSFDTTYYRRMASQGIVKPMQEVFEEIYQRDHWKGEVSVSGPGSGMEQTATLRSVLPGILSDLDIKVLLDLPCGDYAWLSKVELPIAHYIGGDIVASLVEENHLAYGDSRHAFRVMDLCRDDLPGADLLLCRDCLVHFSFADLQLALENIRQSGIPFLLATTFPERHENEDIITGDWRPLNLEKAPFYFPPPLKLINEHCTEGDGAFADKSLGLWRIND